MQININEIQNLQLEKTSLADFVLRRESKSYFFDRNKVIKIKFGSGLRD